MMKYSRVSGLFALSLIIIAGGSAGFEFVTQAQTGAASAQHGDDAAWGGRVLQVSLFGDHGWSPSRNVSLNHIYDEAGDRFGMVHVGLGDIVTSSDGVMSFGSRNITLTCHEVVGAAGKAEKGGAMTIYGDCEGRKYRLAALPIEAAYVSDPGPIPAGILSAGAK